MSMRKVVAKQVVKTVSQPTVGRDNPPENAIDVTSSSEMSRHSSVDSIDCSEDTEELLLPLSEEEEYSGSVLAMKKRTRSHSLKAMPQVSIGDGYSFASGQEFKEHTDFITKVRFFHDSTSIVLSAGNDGLLVHYDLETGIIHKRRAHRKGITDFDISKQNQFLVSSSLDGQVKLWSLQKTLQKPLSVFNIDERANAVCFNPRNINQFVVGDAKGRVLLFSNNSHQPTVISPTPVLSIFNLTVNKPEAINTMIFSSTGQYLITGDAGGELVVYEQTNGKFQVVQRTNLRSAITGFSYCEKTNRLIVASCDHKARIFSVPSLKLVQVFFHQQGTYSCAVAFSPDSKLAIVSSEDYNIHLFDIETGGLLKKWEAHSAVVSSVDIECVDSKIITSSYNGEIKVWIVEDD